MRRLVLPLLIALTAGIGAGLYVGWVVAPVEYVNTGPESLQQSFKDDYILMIATAFAGDGDLNAAQSALTALGFTDPAGAVTEANGRLAANGLPTADQDRLAALASALAALP
jgi:hypothetical protein